MEECCAHVQDSVNSIFTELGFLCVGSQLPPGH